MSWLLLAGAVLLEVTGLLSATRGLGCGTTVLLCTAVADLALPPCSSLTTSAKDLICPACSLAGLAADASASSLLFSLRVSLLAVTGATASAGFTVLVVATAAVSFLGAAAGFTAAGSLVAAVTVALWPGS